jgi:hypothetical protein
MLVYAPLSNANTPTKLSFLHPAALLAWPLPDIPTPMPTAYEQAHFAGCGWATARVGADHLGASGMHLPVNDIKNCWCQLTWQNQALFLLNHLTSVDRHHGTANAAADLPSAESQWGCSPICGSSGTSQQAQSRDRARRDLGKQRSVHL